MKFQIPTFFSGTADRSSLRQSRSFGSGLSVSGAGSGSLGRHPPLPPKAEAGRGGDGQRPEPPPRRLPRRVLGGRGQPPQDLAQ